MASGDNLRLPIDDTNEKGESGNASEELGVMIDDLLNDLSGKFNTVSAEIVAKMDDMSRRIDNLETSMQFEQAKTNPGVDS